MIYLGIQIIDLVKNILSWFEYMGYRYRFDSFKTHFSSFVLFWIDEWWMKSCIWNVYSFVSSRYNDLIVFLEMISFILSLKREERTSFFIHTQWINSFALWCMLSRMKDNWCSKENTYCYSIWMSSISCFVNRLSTNDHQWKKSVQNNHFFFMM